MLGKTKSVVVMSLLALLLAPIGVAGCKDASAAPSAATEIDPLVVHEWGTFTSFQGADGVSLEGLQHETEALPSFVHSRLSADASPLSVYGDPSRDVPVRRCTGKMETPVIYFHTKTPRRVKVEVSYKGLLTQWYPAASRAIPAFTSGVSERHDLSAVPTSSLDWDLDLIPAPSRASSRSAAAIPAIPKVAADSDWQKAREVDAAYLRTVGSNKPAESEQYIFYRGLMRTVPQPRITTDPVKNDAITITNASAETLHAAFVLDMKRDGFEKANTSGGGQGRFISLGALPPGSRAASFDKTPYRSRADVVADVTRAMTAALEAEGLFGDEARAMVRTWSEPWFSSGGTRVLYLVPRSVTDDTLPLRITPTPHSLVRVIVGRVEYLPHDQQEQVARDVIDSVDPATRGPALTRIANLGRFAEPATRAAAASSNDPRMPAAASRVLGIVMRH